MVLWFTGLSGAGKTTIAARLKAMLEAEGKTVAVIDGDVVRDTLHTNLGFTPEDIRENNRLIAELVANETADVVLVPIISPFRDSRAAARARIGERFLEVYIACPLEVVAARDTKGLYRKAKEGAIDNLIGVHAQVPFEEPEHPDIRIDTDGTTPEEAAGRLRELLRERGVE